MRTVFFFARSPDAPRTTMMVLSLSSMVLELERKISHGLREVKCFHEWTQYIPCVFRLVWVDHGIGHTDNGHSEFES